MNQLQICIDENISAWPLPLDPPDVKLWPVRADLRKARWLSVTMSWVIVQVAASVGLWVAPLPTQWLWLLELVPLAGYVWGMVLVPFQVRNYAWGMSEECLYVRKGAMFCSLETIPLARVQYVEVEKGPLLSLWGLANLTINTAASVDPKIYGLSLSQAEQLRNQIMRQAADRLAGL